MPEGDSVFRVANRLHEAFAGKALKSGEIRHPRLSTVTMAGWRITEVVPVGKHLLIRFDNGQSLHSHLRMDGEWHVYRPGARWRHAGHHVRAVLTAEDRVAVGFRLHDLALLPTEQESRLIGHLGPDLMADDWGAEQDAEALRRLSEQDTREVGLALLDQSVVAGIGNVYVAETCFKAGVSPLARVVDLTEQQRLRMIRTGRELLQANRLRSSRTTTGDPRPGNRYWVYQRRRLPCRRCGTPISSASLGTGLYARETWFCPRCQAADRVS